MESQVPSHVSKSQHGGKIPTFEPQAIMKIWLIIIKGGSFNIICKNSHGSDVESWV